MIVIDSIDTLLHFYRSNHRLHLPSAISDKEKSCQCFYASAASRFLFGVLFLVLILLSILDTIVIFQIHIDPDFRIRFSVAQEAHSLHMRGDGTRILHGKSYYSILSPPFAKEYSDFSVYPTGRFLPHFSGFHPFSGSATPAIHFGKTIAHFVSPLSMSLSHLGTIGTFFPARISFMISSVSSFCQNLLQV